MLLRSASAPYPHGRTTPRAPRPAADCATSHPPDVCSASSAISPKLRPLEPPGPAPEQHTPAWRVRHVPSTGLFSPPGPALPLPPHEIRGVSAPPAPMPLARRAPGGGGQGRAEAPVEGEAAPYGSGGASTGGEGSSSSSAQVLQLAEQVGFHATPGRAAAASPGEGRDACVQPCDLSVARCRRPSPSPSSMGGCTSCTSCCCMIVRCMSYDQHMRLQVVELERKLGELHATDVNSLR